MEAINDDFRGVLSRLEQISGTRQKLSRFINRMNQTDHNDENGSKGSDKIEVLGDEIWVWNSIEIYVGIMRQNEGEKWSKTRA